MRPSGAALFLPGVTRPPHTAVVAWRGSTGEALQVDPTLQKPRSDEWVQSQAGELVWEKAAAQIVLFMLQFFTQYEGSNITKGERNATFYALISCARKCIYMECRKCQLCAEHPFWYPLCPGVLDLMLFVICSKRSIIVDEALGSLRINKAGKGHSSAFP